MKHLALLASTGLALALSVAASAKVVTYTLPDETVAFKPGPNLDVVQGNCSACHSADYVVTQPKGPAYKKAFWEAEFAKMINVYGAPIAPADVPKIVEYLVQVY